MINSPAEGPYGLIEEDQAVTSLTASEINRLVQQKRPLGYRQWRKVIDGADHISSAPLEPVVDGADFEVKSHNEGLIQGLFVNSTPIENDDPADYIDLKRLRSKHANSKQDIVPDTVSPIPTSIVDDIDQHQRVLENVVKINKSDVQQQHEQTEELTQKMIEVQKRNLANILSFDNSGGYLEAFARDGLRLKTDLEVEDSPLHFLSNLCSIEVISTYLEDSNIPPEIKDYYMRQVTDYFIERSKTDANTARNQKALRYHKSKTQGQVEDDATSSGAGTVVRRK